jgi:putative ABC transport system permease protein
MTIIDIAPWRLAMVYLLLAIPLGIILWQRIPILGGTLVAVVRMTLQLIFVGFYLQFIFDLNNPWVTGA